MKYSRTVIRMWIVAIAVMFLIAVFATRADMRNYQPQSAEYQMRIDDALHNAETIARMGGKP